jgi:predicted permease
VLTIADLKYALRLLFKSPWFTLITVVVLTGGLGISLFTYAVLDTLIYGELPLPEGDSIVTVGTGEWPNVAPLDAFEVAELGSRAEGLNELGGYRSSRALLGGVSSGRNVRSTEADWRVFEFSRTPPHLGRGFVREDSLPGAEPVAVLSYELWDSEYSADPEVLGDPIRINNRLVRVVGVMPEGFSFPTNSELWLPLGQGLTDPPGYTGELLKTYARLRDGVSEAAAETEASAIVRRLRAAYSIDEDREPRSVSVMSFQEKSFGIFGDVVFGVLNLLACSILLLAAVNVGNLLLARMNRRIREVGVRIALGAPRVRLVLQVVLENLLICAIGAVGAVALAVRGLEATNVFMRNLLGEDLPFWWNWRLEGHVLSIAGLVLLATIVVVSVFPAIGVCRTDPNAVLREGARGGGANMGRLSRALVTVQVALIAAFMVVGSTAAVIAQRVANFDFGMPIDDLLTSYISLPSERYATPESQQVFRERLLHELRAAPEVDAAMIMEQEDLVRFRLGGEDYASRDDYPAAWRVFLSDTPDSIGPSLLEGRAFDGRDDSPALKTAIVSESLARAHWPKESPLGRTIELVVGASETERRTIVGVFRDIAQDPIGVTAVGNSAIYLPLSQASSPNVTVVVRHRGNAARTSAAIYEVLRQLDPALAPGRVLSFREGVDQLTLFGRVITQLFAGCGAFAILLAVTGIFGMSSNAVLLRRHEIGLRRALGASHRNIVGIFIGQGSRQLTVGLVFSALLSAGVLAIASQGFSLDPASLAGIAAAVVSIVSTTVLSSIYLSVRRVLKLEPSAVLRQA